MKSSDERRSQWPLIAGIVLGVLALTAGPALAALTFSGTNISGDSSVVVDSSSTISIGTSTATGITIGRIGQAVNFPGNLSTTNATTTNLAITALGTSGSNCLTVGAAGNVATTTCGGSSQWTTSGTAISYNAGNVGIGTTCPIGTPNGSVCVGGSYYGDGSALSGIRTFNYGSGFNMSGQTIGGGSNGANVYGISAGAWSYWATQLPNGDLLYASSRTTTNADNGVAEINPATGQTVFSWNDPTWVAGKGPESIFKYSNGDYLISDVDAAAQVYEMTPSHTKVWQVSCGIANSTAGIGRPATINGIDGVLMFNCPNHDVEFIKRSDQTVVKTFTGFNFINNGGFRNIGGTNYLILADWLDHKIIEVNYDTGAVVYSHTYTGITSGPYDVQWIDDDHVLVAGGQYGVVEIRQLSTDTQTGATPSFIRDVNAIPVGFPYSAELTPDGLHAWVTTSESQIHYISLADLMPDNNTEVIAPLRIYGPTTAYNQFVLNNPSSNSTPSLKLTDGPSTLSFYISTSQPRIQIGSDSADDVSLLTNGSNRARFWSGGGFSFGSAVISTDPGNSNIITGGNLSIAGNVGIGTATPSTTLQVAGASSTIRIGTSALPGCLEVGNSDGSGGINYVTFLNGVISATTTKPSACQ